VIDADTHSCSYLESAETCAEEGRAVPQAACTVASNAENQLFCTCGDGAGPQLSAASRGVVAGRLSVLLASLFMPSRWGAMVMVGALFVVPVESHNWIEGKRGRAGALQASTVQPALQPLSVNKIDVQVVPGQEFLVEWVYAHGAGGDTYFVVLANDDVSKIHLHTEELLDDYIANAPANSDHGGAPTSNRYQRYQRCSSDDLRNGFFTRAVPSSDPDAMGNRPNTFSPGRFGPIESQMQHSQASISTDRRVSYVSAKYPWIEAVHRYKHSGGQDQAFDTSRIAVPGRSGAGRYLIHYLWSSYRDIIDIDVHLPTAAVPVVLAPYGRVAPAGTALSYAQIDHCAFEAARAQSGKCIEAPTDGELLRTWCDGEINCLGIALVPAHGIAPWINFSHLPFVDTNGACNRTEMEATPPGTMAHYAVTQYRDFQNGATPPWTIYTDPDFIGWHSTCYVKESKFVFDLPVLPLAAPAVLETPFRFGSKCIPCEDRGMDLSNGPRWRVADTCVDCDEEPATTIRSTVLTPAINSQQPGFFTSVTACDGRGRHGNPDPPCASTFKWVVIASTHFMRKDECLAKAASDPECSNHVSWINAFYDWRLVNDYAFIQKAKNNCACWLNATYFDPNANATTPTRSTSPDEGRWEMYDIAPL
jgi:hypothetical protein